MKKNRNKVHIHTTLSLSVTRHTIDRPPNAARQLQVLGHDGDPLGVDGAQVGVFKEVDDEILGRLLEGQQGFRGPAEGFGGDPVGDFAGLGEAGGGGVRVREKVVVAVDFFPPSSPLLHTHQPSKRQLANEQLGGALILANFAQRDGAGAVAARLGRGSACGVVKVVARRFLCFGQRETTASH